MGLGGAEFRLPVLVGIFKFKTIHAIIINLCVSLVTVVFSLLFRSVSLPLSEVIANFDIVLNLLAGSLVGAFLGARLALRVKSSMLNTIVFVFLAVLGIFMFLHAFMHFDSISLETGWRIFFGVVAGLIIGIVSSMLGVAGGELIIPTIILLYAMDIKMAGSLSLCISIPTILIGLSRYRKNAEFEVVALNKNFLLTMALGSVAGAFIGSRVLTGIDQESLQLFLGIILLISAIKTFSRKH